MGSHVGIFGTLKQPSEKEEIARMYAQTACIPNLALDTFDNYLAVRRRFPAGPIEQKRVSRYFHDVQ